MATVLSYSMSDPFAPPTGRKSGDDHGARYQAPPFVPAGTSMMGHGSVSQHSLPSTASTRASASTRPQSTRATSAYQTIVDEFGAYVPQQSTSRAHRSQAPTMPLPLPTSQPIASLEHASSHPHGTSQSTSAQRKRQSHNPAAVMQPSPPKSEYLSDEYVLHPSVHSYKQAHPNRAMIALGQYILLQTLGEGEFGKVKLGVHSEYGVEVAIKLIRRGQLDDETRANKVEREIEVLKQLKHPNIVRMLDVIDTVKYIGIVLEFAGGGELFDYILANRYLKEKDASRLFAQLISGVDYLHQKHIVHRDLKLENLLLDKHRNIIITDFGFANRFERDEDDLMATSCGSPCYAAPELVVSEGLYVGTAVDVWSCGVILYAMLAGYLPYDDDPNNPDGDNINLLYKYIMSTPLNFPEHISRLAKDLLMMMLVPDPRHRCTIPGIQRHTWLEGHRALFSRSVAEQEAMFSENMSAKSQQAKRDLAQRRRLQQEARLVKALQRSQSTAPTMALDQPRRKEPRQRAALPGATTMPEYLYNAGHQSFPSATSHRQPALDEFREASGPPSAPPAPLPMLPPPALPVPPAPQAASSAPRTPPRPPRRVSDVRMDVDQEDPTTPVRPTRRPQPSPASANKNRHTIQVEYDGNMHWHQVSGDGSPTRQGESSLQPPHETLRLPQMETEMESSDDQDSASIKIGDEPQTPELVHSVPSASESVQAPARSNDTRSADSVDKPDVAESVHTSESASSTSGGDNAMAPPPRPPRRSEPATPTKRSREENIASDPVTPKATVSESQLATPRAAGQRSTSSVQLPPGAATPTKQPSSSLPEDDALSALPPPPARAAPAKRDRRSRKGMSLDKFSLAKLLGGQPSSETKANESRPAYVPASQHSKSQSMAMRSSMPPTTADTKKSRHMSVQLGSSRTSTPDAGATTPIIGPQGIQPRPSHDQQSSTSIVTVDAVQEPQANRSSSSAAKRVMDWFRRKSLAKDTLTSIKTNSGSVRADSTSSIGASRPSSSAERAYAQPPRFSLDQARAPSQASSVSQRGPSIVISGAPIKEEPARKSIDVIRAVDRAAAAHKAPVRVPLAPANGKTNVDEKNLLSPERGAMPQRSKSVRTPHGMHHSMGGDAGLVSPHSVADTKGKAPPSAEDAKMRVHTGLVDQSALTSRPPAEVMAEVIRVLHSMGIEVKLEAEYRLRCTRVRRRKAGPTTSLSTAPHTVGHIGAGSIGRTDSRGLPLPSSGSGGLSGLKGMLLRRGSSYSSHHSSALMRSESDLLSASASSTPQIASPHLGPVREPLYGEHSIDNGDEVRFAVELCRIKNLQGLYLLSIKRLRGSVWSFKFIYQTIVERSETLTH